MDKMKRAVLYCCMVLLGAMAICAVPVFAEDAKPLISAEDLKHALGMSIYLQGGYTANLNNPDSGQNDLRVFDHQADSFALDLAEIIFAKDPAVGNAGFKLKLSAGETAKWIHSAGLSGADLSSPEAGEGTDAFDVTEAYISYIAAVGKGIRFDFGKMVTFLGAEVIEAKDNPNYSRSFLFNYAIAFTHTGLKMNYAFTDALSTSFYIVNGWDNSTDNNKSKSYGVSIGYAPTGSFSGYVNYMTGAEQNNNINKGNMRSILDIVATIKPTQNLSFILNADNGKEDDALAPGDAKWNGVAGIVKYDFNSTYSLAVRAETFNDKDGYRTGTAQKLKEVTITPEIRLSGNVILRPEYRHDSSDQASFDINSWNNSAKNRQDTVALGVMYSW